MGRAGWSDKANPTPPSAADIERIGRAVLAELPALFRQHVRDVVPFLSALNGWSFDRRPPREASSPGLGPSHTAES